MRIRDILFLRVEAVVVEGGGGGAVGAKSEKA